MRKNGFSLIEAMFAGVVMIGIAMAAYQLLTGAWKSSGDLEKRNRYRDLIDDIRFVFSEPNLCKESFSKFSLTEGADVSVNVSSAMELRGQTHLPEYGIQLDRLYLKNVRTFPPVRKTLFRSSGEVLGNFDESSQVADVYVEASLTGSKQKLKSMAAVRVAFIQRTGAITEFSCFGNHMVTSAAPTASAVPNQDNRLPSSNSGSFDSSALPQPSVRPVYPTGTSTGTYSAQDCELSSSDMQIKLSRNKLVNGEVVTFTDADGLPTTATCNQGRFSVLKKD